MSGSLFDDERAGWRRRRAREIRAELADHIERRTAALIARGFTPEAARSEALRRIGDSKRIEEEVSATFALRGAVEGLLYGVQPFDPVSLAFAAGTLLITSLLACSIPGIRAARLDPLTAVREE